MAGSEKVLMSNEKLAGLWREVGPYHKRKIESILIETNKGLIFTFLNQKHPPEGYNEILLNAIRMSIHDALRKFEHAKGLKFITYWIWWMSSHYSRTILNEISTFPQKGNAERRKSIPEAVPIDSIVEQGFTPEPYEHDIKSLIIKRYQGKERQIFLMLADGIDQKEISVKVNLSINRIRLTIAKERQALRRLVLQGF